MSFTPASYRPLSEFFRAHFGEGWNSSSDNWQEIVARFVEDVGRETADELAQQIWLLLAQTKSDVTLVEILTLELGCCYKAGSSAKTRAWLQELSKALKIDSSNLVDIGETGREVFVPGIVFDQNIEQKKLSASDLEPGDVLVWAADKKSPDPRRTHYFIRDGSGGAYSHASIYVGVRDGILCTVDAGPDGVHFNWLDDLLSYFALARVFRTALPPHDLVKVVAAAEGFVGIYSYSMNDVKLLPLRRRVVRTRGVPGPFLYRLGLSPVNWFGKRALADRKRNVKETQTFCSHLVVQAYAVVGFFPLQDVEEAAISPNDLVISNYFPCIGYISNRSIAGKPPKTLGRDIFAVSYRFREKSLALLYWALWRL
jgi:hypothetical protein